MPRQLVRPISCAAFVASILFLFAAGLSAAEVVPPQPARYFNDGARVVSPAVADALNTQLENYEKETSCQILAAIFPKMQTRSSIEDYSQRIFEAWKPGRKNLDNGAILLVFVQDRKMRIHTGYGLEGALPDALCKQILEDQIAPRLQAGDFNGAMTLGVKSILEAARGEYKGTGQTAAGKRVSQGGTAVWMLMILIFITTVVLNRRRGAVFTGVGRSNWGGSWYTGGGGFSGGGGGGDFSGGGGSSGGGGASGSW
jgi:uncharacterized protein